MAGRGNPSFLKNQKAKKRMEKATEKRAARQARNAEKAAARAAAKAGGDTEPEIPTADPGEAESQESEA